MTLYERVPEPGPIGAGIILQPTGQSVLGRLGLREAVVARGERLDLLRVVRAGGEPLMELSYRDVSERYYGVGLHRGALFAALFGAVKAEPGVELRLGVTCQNIVRGPRSTLILVDDQGERVGCHDLIVAADGARSRFRDDTGLARSVTPYPWGALWFVAHDKDRRYRGKLVQTVKGTRRMIGILPTGIGPARADGSDGPPLVSLFWSIAASAVARWREAGFESWREEILELVPDAEPIVGQIDSIDQILFSQYFDVVMRPWNTRAIVHLGDSAHAMSPQLGQGANLALYDAMVLADCIAVERGDVVRALDLYSRTRRAHLTYYELATRWLTPFFQSDHDLLGMLRDVAMPFACRFGPMRRAMVLGMTGTAQGGPFWELTLPE